MTVTPSPDQMALRSPPRPVTRLSKKAVVIASACFVLILFGALTFALNPPSAQGETGRNDLYNTASKPIAESLQGLPQSYADIETDPLGPPVRGEVERAIVLAQQRASAPAPALSNASAVQKRSIRSAPISDANKSALFFERGSAAPISLAPEQQFAELLGESLGGETSLRQHASGYAITAGTLIPASLVTGINSDLPGTAIAQVTQNVYDSLNGDYVLIPQGARLIGVYDNQTNFGQRRVFISWTRIINPDGSSVNLQEMSASDLSGYSGLSDRVNNHTGQLVKAGILATVLGVGAELSVERGDGEIAQAVRDAIQGTANTAGQKIIQRQLNMQPTLTIRPGWSFQIIVSRDLTLPPYEA